MSRVHCPSSKHVMSSFIFSVFVVIYSVLAPQPLMSCYLYILVSVCAMSPPRNYSVSGEKDIKKIHFVRLVKGKVA